MGRAPGVVGVSAARPASSAQGNTPVASLSLCPPLLIAPNVRLLTMRRSQRRRAVAVAIGTSHSRRRESVAAGRLWWTLPRTYVRGYGADDAAVKHDVQMPSLSRVHLSDGGPLPDRSIRPSAAGWDRSVGTDISRS